MPLRRDSRRLVMGRTIGLWLRVAGLLLLNVQIGFSQSPQRIPAPLFPPSQSMSLGQPELHQSIDVYDTDTTFEDRNGPLLIGNPLLDNGGLGRLGWFGTVEIDMLDAR